MKSVPAKYRTPARLLVWCIGMLSIAVSFFTLPIAIAIPLSLLCLVIPWLVSRLVFQHHIVWVMPPLSPESERNRLGTMWFKEPVGGKEFVGLGLLYEDKEWAQDAYRTIKSWNFGQTVDAAANINVTIIAEGEHRYSMFVYPGHRAAVEEAIKSSFLSEQPPNTQATVSRLFYFTSTCADYSSRPEVEEVVLTLRRRNRILLNTYYCNGDEVEPYAKRPFQINHFRFEDRASLAENCPEYHSPWEDGRLKEPESAKRTDQLSKKFFANQTKT